MIQKKWLISKVLAFTFMFVLLAGSMAVMANAMEGDDDYSQSVTFGVVSDTHLGAAGHGISVLEFLTGYQTTRNRLNKVLDFFTEQNVDAFSVVGDITSDGTATQFNYLKDSLDGHLPAYIERILTMGNHDSNNWLGFENATGSKANDHKVINGYHFIMVSPGLGEIDPFTGRATVNSTGSYLTSWVADQIEIAEADPYAAGKPIFVFFHHPIRGTFYVSDEWNSGSWGDGMNNIFNDHPQVVTFSGHIHSPNNDPRSIWQDGGFTAVNTVTTYYYEMESGYIGNANWNSASTLPKPDGAAMQGLLVSVKGTKVEIKNYDFIADEFLEQTWTFDVSEPLPYTNERVEKAQKPVFTNKNVKAVTGKVSLSSFSSSGVTATFDQAYLPQASEVGEVVHSYRIDVINRNTDAVVASKKQWSDFMHVPMQPKYTQAISGLSSGTPYELRIYAYGSFQLESDQYLTVKFTGYTGVDPDVDPAIGVDKSELEAIIAMAYEKMEEDYTVDSWAAFAAALDEAQQTYDDERVTQEYIDAAAADLSNAMDSLVSFAGVSVIAYVDKISGNQNDLTIVITEFYTDGSEIILEKTIRINNNAADIYVLGDYKVYVNTKGNTQIRECYFVE